MVFNGSWIRLQYNWFTPQGPKMHGWVLEMFYPTVSTHSSVAPADVEGNEEMATVVDLIPWTEYEFRVVATNTLGTGEPSSPSPKDKTEDAGKTVSWLRANIGKGDLWSKSQSNLKGHGNVVPAVQFSTLTCTLHHSIIALFTYVKYCCRYESAEIPSSCTSFSRSTLPN